MFNSIKYLVISIEILLYKKKKKLRIDNFSTDGRKKWQENDNEIFYRW